MKTYRTSLPLRFQIAAGILAFAASSASGNLLVATGNTILDFTDTGTLNGTFATLPAGFAATGMTESGGDIYIAANNADAGTGLIYKYNPTTSTLSSYATPGLGTGLQQVAFASDGFLYVAVQQGGANGGVWRTNGVAQNQIQSNGQNVIGLTSSGDGKYVVWGYAGPSNAASLDAYGDISGSPGVFNLLGPTGGVVGLGGTGNYYTPTAITSTAGGFIAGVYAGGGKTFVKTGVNYANAGATLWQFGSDSDSNNQINGLTVDPSGNLYVCVSTQGNIPAIYSFAGQSGSPTLVASVAGAGNILHFVPATVTTTYVDWANSNHLDPLTDGAPGFDKDNDGATNLQEYAFFTDPNSGISTPSLVAVTDSSNVTLTYQRAVKATDVTYSAESSTDLVTWSTLGVTDAPTGNTTDNTTEYRATAAKGSDPAKFLRVQVTLAP